MTVMGSLSDFFGFIADMWYVLPLVVRLLFFFAFGVTLLVCILRMVI